MGFYILAQNNFNLSKHLENCNIDAIFERFHFFQLVFSTVSDDHDQKDWCKILILIHKKYLEIILILESLGVVA